MQGLLDREWLVLCLHAGWYCGEHARQPASSLRACIHVLQLLRLYIRSLDGLERELPGDELIEYREGLIAHVMMLLPYHMAVPAALDRGPSLKYLLQLYDCVPGVTLHGVNRRVFKGKHDLVGLSAATLLLIRW